MSLAPRIVVTGAAGRLGRLVIDRLLQKGCYEILGADVTPFPDCPVPFVKADLCDAAQARELVGRADGVIHLAAVPGPSSTTPPGVDPEWGVKATIGLESMPPGELLLRNTASAYNVFEAAASGGAARVVFSSSAFAMGWTHDPSQYQPRYFPLDEVHPPLPHETYGLSKLVGEDTAAAIARACRGRTTFASLRFTNVVHPDKEHLLPWAPPSADAPSSALMWAWTKAGEVADAHVLALEAESVGPEHHEAFLIAAPTTRFRERTEELLSRLYPGVPLKAPLPGNTSVISAAKAGRILGWRPTTTPQLQL